MKMLNTRKTPIALHLSALLSGSLFAPVAFAADEPAADQAVEVISVKGIRSSIQESTRLKRDSAGVVDAISAEDMGKFPDTNLAESLQRITGVSIDRANGEGSKVTVRGFGPDYNMVTLNGRTMPGASLPFGGGVPSSRAFDFANLASDSIRSVEVYKTGQANIATGGIGATLNITTARPLDRPGTRASFGVKGMHDTTVRIGDDVTPELSGMFSWTNDDATWGVAVSGNFQERDSSASGAYVNQWRTSAFNGSIPQAADDIDLTNAPDIGQLYSMPSDLRYTIADRSRTRTNGQITFQYALSDTVTATLDYTYSKLDLFEARAEQSIWMDNYKTALTFDDEVVKTPIGYQERRLDQLPRDLGLALQELNQVNENKSLGFRIDAEVGDYWTVMFDAHHSTAEGRPDAPHGTWINTGLGANVVNAQAVNWNLPLPSMILEFNDSLRTNLNGNGVLDITDVGTSMLQRNVNLQDAEINQARLNAKYEFEDSGNIAFGVEYREQENLSQHSFIQNQMGNWGIENPGELPDGIISMLNIAGLFDNIPQGTFNQAVYGSASEVGAWAAQQYGFDFYSPGASSTDSTIKEEILAAFVQWQYQGELGDMPYNLRVGVRYETTDITSTALINLPTAIAWEGNNDFSVRYGDEPENFALDADYNHTLPNIDFDISLTETIKARLSYSTTIARPTFNHLNAAVGVGVPNTPSSIPGAAPATASAGNPALVPLESDNIDLSIEWYFDETSYVSIGYYDKKVENFIGTAPSEQNFFGLRDATNGPRAQAAIAALEAMGLPITDSNLFQMVVATENGLAFDAMTYEEFESLYDVLPNADDPLIGFITQRPVNNKDAKIDGFEFALQHFFGDSGFGFQTNYTTVNGDVDFDIAALPSVTQFALVGLSDTANVVLMYEKNEWQARIAYNWRDKFLNNPTRYINEPAFTEEYSQIDFSVSYLYNEQLTFTFEGINITEEDTRQHGRTWAQLWNYEQQGARYAVGMRYVF